MIRDELREAFLIRAGWANAKRAILAGDASNRKYDRLTEGPEGAGAVLMDAPPEKGEDVRPFVAIARFLLDNGLSAPRIFAEDTDNGFLLIEDLGDALFSKVVAADENRERALYLAATDVLVALHKATPPEAPDYGPETMTEVAGLASDWYAFGATGTKDESGKSAIKTALRSAFAALAPFSSVLVLRDYHAENLLWLPERRGAAAVGLLDFQDAGLGHPAYDLMSLGRDARRDVDPATCVAMIDHYCAATGVNRSAFERACATVSAQRNLRILGVFARLSMLYGKPHYVDLIPRVWGNLVVDLDHPDLADLRAAVFANLPTPSPDILQNLKDKCATIPLP